MSIKSKIIAYTDGSGAFWFLVSLIVLVVGFYIYSVNWAVLMVAQREEAETKITEARSEIAKLETGYITEVNSITRELATSLGYRESSNTVYVQKRSLGLAAAEAFQ